MYRQTLFLIYVLAPAQSCDSSTDREGLLTLAVNRSVGS